MTRINEKFADVRLVFMCFLVLYTAVREVSPLHFLISSSYVSAAIFAVGFILIFLGLFFSRTCFSDRRTDVFALFLAVTAVSCAVNFKYGYSDNIKALGAMVLFFFLFFDSGIKKTAERRRFEIDCITGTFCVVWALFTFLSVVMFCTSIFYIVDDGGWIVTNQGFSTILNRLWGVFHDPNYAGYISDVVIIFSVRFILKNRKRLFTLIINTLNCLLQFAFLTLAGSFSANIILIASAVLFCFYFCLSRLGEKSFLCIVKSSVAAVLCGALCLGFIVSGQYILPYARKIVDNLPQSIPIAVTQAFDDLYGRSDLTIKKNKCVYKIGDVEKNTDSSPIKRSDTNKSDEDMSHGRFDRWLQTLEIFASTPVFGTSPRNTPSYAKEKFPQTLMAKYNMASHNGYLDILAGTGAIGFAVFLLFFLPALIALIKKYFLFENDIDFITSVTAVFITAVSALFVSDLFFMISIGAFVFWTFFGYALHSDGVASDKKGILMKAYEKIFSFGRIKNK